MSDPEPLVGDRHPSPHFLASFFSLGWGNPGGKEEGEMLSWEGRLWVRLAC